MLQYYTPSLTGYKRLPTKEVRIGDLLLGNGHPVRIQTMTTTDTMDTAATVAQTIRCIEAGAELVRITAPSKKEAENLAEIRKQVRAAGFNTPLVADIHFTPNAAEVAARIVEKVRVNPGNYVDKKKFDFINYTDAEYHAEIERIRDRFTPLVRICKEHGTAMRIGTNHGSLSDRIMSRYGDSPIGMVESALEFLRIARDENYHQIVLSMKSSNPQVMVQAYRLLVQKMDEEFGECYPLHLGVTEAGDGEDGRIKSAVGIGTLLEDGIGDTIRVSLTEDPEFEIPVCRDLVQKYDKAPAVTSAVPPVQALPYDSFAYRRRKTFAVQNIGAAQVPVVIADLSKENEITPRTLESVGYHYDEATDKWNIGDQAADYIFTGNTIPEFALPGTLRVLVYASAYTATVDQQKVMPLFDINEYAAAACKSPYVNFVMLDCYSDESTQVQFELLQHIGPDVVLCLSSTNDNAMQSVRRMFIALMDQKIENPVVIISDSSGHTPDEHLVKLVTDTGALLLDGMGDGICLGYSSSATMDNAQTKGRTYLPVKDINQFTNNTAFSILQATRTRISKTEYISCPSCGRTLFDLQETTAKIREATHHLKGVKIAIMGCIVNGPGEMADADFGYVGSGVGKITLYKNKDVVKKNVPSDIAVDELIQLLKDNGAWVDR
ncbi:MAG TPA: (E)-4-hydroxy-3-methylbut-2-enyl-diphosphate synthase [Chitinophagaceae bacterium]|nr:(E)-4-hydroxy-3-methylbut-2-enyl-diphosphate synthase [Chitinophagaceae bacterium]